MASTGLSACPPQGVLAEKLRTLATRVAGLPTKTQLQKLLAENKIPGTVSGKGSDWELELPDDKAYDLWKKTLGKKIPVGGYRAGYGGWVLRPGYKDKGDPNDPSSRWHY